jgi:hypothetical protein
MSRTAHHPVGQPSESGLCYGVRLQIEVAIDRALETSSPGERGERRQHEPLHCVGGLTKADLPAKAGGKQRAEQRLGAPFGVRVPIGGALAEGLERGSATTRQPKRQCAADRSPSATWRSAGGVSFHGCVACCSALSSCSCCPQQRPLRPHFSSPPQATSDALSRAQAFAATSASGTGAHPQNQHHAPWTGATA